MCFGKKEKPQPSAGREPAPRQAGPPQVSQQPLSQHRPSSRRASKRFSWHNFPVSQGQDLMDRPPVPPVDATGYSPQLPRERGLRRASSQPNLRQPQESDQPQESTQQRAAKRRSGISRSDRGIVIAVMGVTGAGKSYFIREVTGNPEVKVSAGLQSYTSKIQPYTFEYAGAKITLVDTPSFNDTQRSDTEVLQEITDWTSATYRKKQLLSGIIYLHPITHTRMEGSAIKNLRLFQNLCGQEVLDNVLLTTTQWSDVDPAEGQAREDSLRDEGLWGGLIGKGATLQRFRGTRESGLELILKLMSHTRKPLRIQDQIVGQQMALPETDAGKCLNEALAAQEERFRKELESLEKQFREAIRAKDGEMNRILTAEQAKVREKLEKAQAERRWLEGLRAARMGEAGPSRPRAAHDSRTRRQRPRTIFDPTTARRKP